MSEMPATVIEQVQEGPWLLEFIGMQLESLDRKVFLRLHAEALADLCQVLIR